MSNPLPTQADTIVIGGGIIGCSTAYHLATQGCRDVVVLERSKLTSGTTWHSAALVRQLRSTIALTQLTQYSARLYASLARETGQETGWHRCGSLSIATNPDRHTHIRRQASLARAFGIEVDEVDRAEIQRLWPIANTDDMIGGVLLPSDGRVNPSDVCAALVKGAKSKGARVYEDTPVTGFVIANGRVVGVKTELGDIACGRVALCAGLWSREMAALAGVSAPLHACEHFALITKPIDGVSRDMPILGDHDGHMYIREESGGLLVGCFEPNAKPIDTGDLPRDFSFDLLNEDWDHFEPIMEGALHRVPALHDAEARMLLNGPESFTPDNGFLLGETPELGGFFLGCGMNSMGMASGGGVGRALAEWMLEGEPTMDLWPVDVRRFGPLRNDLRRLRERAAETMSLHYALSFPGREPATARNVRLSPVHERLAAKGAWFGERGGWERPNFFRAEGGDEAPELRFGKPSWFDAVAAEHGAARHGVALFDQSPFGKLLVDGADAEPFLHRLCANDIGVAPGRVVYSPMLNHRGGYESDLVVLRLSETEFLLVTGTTQAVRDRHWLVTHLGEDERVTVTDTTIAGATLCVAGPRSRELLRRVSPADFSNAAFPYFTHREIEIGNAVGCAARLSYVGELGWEIYVPADQAPALYDLLCDAGEDLGLGDAGTFAMAGLRLEKGYCAWGHDIGPDDTPLEAGNGFAVKLDKPHPFLGREAILRQRDGGVGKRRVLVMAEDGDVFLQGGEPIVVDGEIVGHVTSAAYGHTVGASVGMGFVKLGGGTVEDLLAGARVEVEVACRRVAVWALREPPHDAEGRRPRQDG
ncbi:MAG: FAD-dependent oxidoreductase [Rhodospirillales bacterium]|jgi:4-methylaminobutanoate oxidase (formaldehyde-forming)|nr:FAD-dependent oxidoreductase [Rhodospirillales bacterium]